MVARGRVQNGVVVLDGSVPFKEGQEVTVLGDAPSGFPGDDAAPRSVLDIPPVSLGAVVRAWCSDDDLFEEMLEHRP